MEENTSRMTIYKGFKREGDMMSILTFFGSNQYLNYKIGASPIVFGFNT